MTTLGKSGKWACGQGGFGGGVLSCSWVELGLEVNVKVKVLGVGIRAYFGLVKDSRLC